MNPDEILERIAASLRREIGPAVAEPFAKTQAFMASVVLEKLARQLRVAEAHARADATDRAALVDELDAQLGATAPAAVRAALDEARIGGEGGLNRLVETLYAERDALGADRFDRVLARVRRTLRAALDRKLEVAT